jgi:hypothetical protein
MRLGVLALLCASVCASTPAFGQAAEGEPEDSEHSAVLEIGGAGALDLSEDHAAHGGGSIAVEKTVIDNWLELELGVSLTHGGGETELAGGLLFKKPFRLSSKVEFMIGVGPELVHSLGAQGGTAPGLVSVLDFMFWPNRNVGWYLEPGYEVVFDHGSKHVVNATAGLLIGF